MTTDQILILAILLATVVMFLWGRWRHDMVALGALLACALTGLVQFDAAFAGLGHPAVVTVACVLVLSKGLYTSGAVDTLARKAMPESAGPVMTTAILTGIAALLSGFMNNVGALALLMPVALQLASRQSLPPGRVLMPLAFGSILGGMTTLVGTPPNLIVAGFRAEAGMGAFRMFDFMPVGLSVAAVGVLFLVLVGWRLVPVRERAGAEGFETAAYLTEVRVPEDSAADGMALHEVERKLDAAGAQVVGMVRNEVRVVAPHAGRRILSGDILVIEADVDALPEVLSSMGLKLEASRPPEEEDEQGEAKEGQQRAREQKPGEEKRGEEKRGEEKRGEEQEGEDQAREQQDKRKEGREKERENNGQGKRDDLEEREFGARGYGAGRLNKAARTAGKASVGRVSVGPPGAGRSNVGDTGDTGDTDAGSDAGSDADADGDTAGDTDADATEPEKTEKKERGAPPEIVLVELAVLPGSALTGRSASDIDLRTRYGINLLAVSRSGRRSTARLRTMQLMPGDVLLMQGPQAALSDFAADTGSVPLAERELRIPSRRKAIAATAIMVLAIATAALGLLPAAVSFAAGVLASMVLRTVPPSSAYQAVDWPVVVLLAALIPVAGAMEATGTADLIARVLLDGVAQGHAIVALTLILVVTMTLSDLMNNAATAAVMSPIAIGTAQQLGVSADSFLMAVAIGASCAFLTPVGHQNNTLILGPGGFRFGDYWRLGLPVEILVVAVSIPMLLLVWPL
ncbi:MAG: anion permease [Burkholderiales bacterium]|nr:MAG: anion permease [Burkholderiales bacterium]